MEKIGVSEAKRRFSEIIDRVSRGETIGLTRDAKLLARIVPAEPDMTLKEIFADLKRIRQRVKLPKGTTIKELIESGRR